MNKKLLWLALLVLAISAFIGAQKAFIYLRYKKLNKKYKLVHNWKRAHAQQRENEVFCDYIELVSQQIRADMEIGKSAMQRAGVWDENGELTAKYRDLASS